MLWRYKVCCVDRSVAKLCVCRCAGRICFPKRATQKGRTTARFLQAKEQNIIHSTCIYFWSLQWSKRRNFVDQERARYSLPCRHAPVAICLTIVSTWFIRLRDDSSYMYVLNIHVQKSLKLHAYCSYKGIILVIMQACIRLIRVWTYSVPASGKARPPLHHQHVILSCWLLSPYIEVQFHRWRKVHMPLIPPAPLNSESPCAAPTSLLITIWHRFLYCLIVWRCVYSLVQGRQSQ